MKKITILLFALLCANVVYGQQKAQEVVVLPRVVQGAISDSDKLFIAANVKNAFAKIPGYRAFNGQSQAVKEAESVFQLSGSISGEQVQAVGGQTGAVYICLLSLSVENNKLIVNSEIIDVASGRKSSDAILFSRSDKNNVFRQCQSIVTGLLRDIRTQETTPVQLADNQKNNVVDNKPASNPNEPGVVINGVRWSTRNVASPGTFTAKPEEPGMFYQWNRSKGWEPAGAVTGWNGTQAQGNTWTEANKVCPSGYRMPTDSEIKSLTAGGGKWTTKNGVKGREFGSGGNTIFMPAAGYRYHKTGTLNEAGVDGYYWSATQDIAEYAYHLYFGSSSSYRGNDYRSYGFSVRCVAE